MGYFELWEGRQRNGLMRKVVVNVLARLFLSSLDLGRIEVLLLVLPDLSSIPPMNYIKHFSRDNTSRSAHDPVPQQESHNTQPIYSISNSASLSGSEHRSLQL